MYRTKLLSTYKKQTDMRNIQRYLEDCYLTDNLLENQTIINYNLIIHIHYNLIMHIQVNTRLLWSRYQ